MKPFGQMGKIILSWTTRTPVGGELGGPVGAGEPDFGGYFSPEDAQEPFFGASTQKGKISTKRSR